MYPRMPWEQAADPLGSTENSWPLDSPISSEGLEQSLGNDWIHGIRVLGIWLKLSFSYIDLIIVEFPSDPAIYCYHLDSGNFTQILNSVFYTKFFCLNQQRIGKLKRDFHKYWHQFWYKFREAVELAARSDHDEGDLAFSSYRTKCKSKNVTSTSARSSRKSLSDRTLNKTRGL
jgi:hypothetical protein